LIRWRALRHVTYLIHQAFHKQGIGVGADSDHDPGSEGADGPIGGFEVRFAGVEGGLGLAFAHPFAVVRDQP